MDIFTAEMKKQKNAMNINDNEPIVVAEKLILMKSESIN